MFTQCQSNMRHALAGYGLAVVSVLGATALRLPLDPLLDDQIPFATYFLALAITACFSRGWGPSLAALVLGFFAADYFFVEPRDAFSIDGLAAQASMALYVVVGAIIIGLALAQGRSRERAKASLAVAVKKEEALQKEIAQRIRAEQRVQTFADELEQRVADRTREVQIANQQLKSEITERNQAERELRSSRDLLEQIINSIPLYVFWKDRHSRYLGCNALFAREAGLGSPGEVIGKSDFELSWKETAELYRADDRSVMDTNTPKLDFDEPLARPDGSVLVIRTNKVPLRDANGQVFGVLGIFEDITERKRTEEALRHIQARQALIIRSVPIVLYSAHSGSTYGGTWVSDNIEDITGFTARQFMDDPDLWISRLHPDDREAALEGARRAVESGSSSAEYRWQCADGHYRWLLDQSVLVTNQAGDQELIGMWLDITDRRQTEEALREAETKFRTLVEQPLLGFYIIGDDGRVAYTNAKLAELFGYSQRELEAADPLNLIAESDRERIAANMRRRLEGQPLPPNYAFKALRKDGTLMDIEVHASRAELHGRPAVIGILRDVTEFNRLQAESRRLERLASWGQLLGGIAHELKNPLFILSGHLQLFKERLKEATDPGLAGDFKKIEEAAKRTVMITEHFLHLSRPATSKRQRCSIRAVLESATEALSHEISRQHISLTMLLDESLPKIWTDPKLLREVFHHLIVNAIEAMARTHGKGTLTVKGAQTDGGIEVRVQDDGPGIPLGQQTRIFEPFFTIKPPDQATGLGLWIVRSNLMVLQGSVKVESEPGQGATFVVRLPQLAESPDGPPVT